MKQKIMDMNGINLKKQIRTEEAAAETYQKGWEIAFSLMEIYFNDKWGKKVKSTS